MTDVKGTNPIFDRLVYTEDKVNPFYFAGRALVFALPAAAQQKPYEPQVGQAGKDVIWVPTPDE
ncbi:MAG: hypothetical protein HC784_05135, partial [Hydrococcus sp. CSU_1_8]|nr:hypothetical protein [Hydrococcus sp. CSU_1_8]